jgi:hypothetical protein
MSDFKIGNSPQPTHEQTEARSEATPVTERSATPAPLQEPDFSKVMEGGLAEHLLNQQGGGPAGVNGPYGGSAEGVGQSASDWLLQQGVLPGGEGMSLKPGPMGGVVDPPSEGAPSVNTPLGIGVIFGNTPQGGATDPPPNMGAIGSGPGELIGGGGIPIIKGQGPQGGGVFDPSSEGIPLENTSIDGRVVWNTPRGGATDPPPNLLAQQGMDDGSSSGSVPPTRDSGGGSFTNTSIPQMTLTDRPATIIPLPPIRFDETSGSVGIQLPNFSNSSPPNNSSQPPINFTPAPSSDSAPSYPADAPLADPPALGDYEIAPYNTEGDPTAEDTGDNPPEEVV